MELLNFLSHVGNTLSRKPDVLTAEMSKYREEFITSRHEMNSKYIQQTAPRGTQNCKFKSLDFHFNMRV